MPRALIVDDDAESALRVADILRHHGYSMETATSLPAAREALLRHMPELAVVNDTVAGDNALDMLESIDLSAVMELYLMSDEPTVRIATRAMRAGASDLLQKPLDQARFAANLQNLQDYLAGQYDSDSVGLTSGALVGDSRAMRKLYRLVRKCASSDASVLIAGERGTGKELVARAVHELSSRARRPFVALNCGALCAEESESELFGHRKGSFTGAVRDHKGYFRRAAGGTLFLDEVTEMDPGVQASLLRALETGTIRPVGEEKEIEVDVRIITAINRDPEVAIAAGRLREDLYYRLAQFPLRVPSLRERGEDIELLARHFLEQRNDETGQSKTFAAGVLDILRLHDWPGNVRELRNAVLHAHLLAGDEIEADDLPGRVLSGNRGSGEYIRLNVGMPLAEVERRVILTTLEKYAGNKKNTAKALGVSLKTLYNRLKLYRA